jgi:hypothetical protein
MEIIFKKRRIVEFPLLEYVKNRPIRKENLPLAETDSETFVRFSNSFGELLSLSALVEYNV